jgi:hypothetical protein
MEEGTSSTVFLLTSPRYLTRHPSMVNAIIEANKPVFIAAKINDGVEQACYKIDDFWNGINLHE